ncbi:MAG: hypothetical protein Phyf2KO_18300 [Phycisphaerales bacterium]
MGRLSRNILPDLERCGNESQPDNHRRHGRLHVQHTECSIGYIEDISCSGMRVMTRIKMKPSNKTIGLRLETLDGPTTLPCRIVWVRRSGFRKWLVGIEYTAMSLDQRKMLTQLARAVSKNECMNGRRKAS